MTIKQLTLFFILTFLFLIACGTPTVESTAIVDLQPSATITPMPTVTPNPSPTPIATPQKSWPPSHFSSLIQQISHANGDSHSPDISANGRWLVFASRADNLVAGKLSARKNSECVDQDQKINCQAIFWYDRQNGSLKQISLASDGTPGNGDSFSPVVSDDGQWVAFASQADNLVVEDTNKASDILIHHLSSGITRRVSTANNGTAGNGNSFAPMVSANGQWVVFASEANNLVFGDTNGLADVFSYNQATGEVARVSLAENGEQSRANSWPLGLSADGQEILFGSAADLTATRIGTLGGLFLHRRELTATKQLVKDESGLGIYAASLSADGRWIAFQYFEGHWDIFVQEVITTTRRKVSLANDGTPANFDSFSPSISADGRGVAFSSRASNLTHLLKQGNGRDNGLENIFWHNLQTGTTELISQNEHGAPGNQTSELPIISADGHWLAFSSSANNLVAGDTNNYSDVFIRQLTHTLTTTTVTTAPLLVQASLLTTTTIGFASADLAISPNGEKLAVVGNDGTHIYSLPNFKHLQYWQSDYWVNSVVWSPDNERVASANYHGSVPVRLAYNGVRATLLGVVVKDDNKTPWQPKVTWSPQGDYIASNSVDEQVYVWRVISGTVDTVLNEDGAAGITGLAWSPDQRRLAVSDAKAVRLWEVSSLRNQTIFPNFGKYQISSLAWSNDGQHIAFGSQRLSDGRGMVHLWDRSAGNAILEGHAREVTDVVWSPMGLLLSASADGVRIWNITTSQSQLLALATDITCIDWSADGRYVVAGTNEGTVYLWQIEIDANGF